MTTNHRYQLEDPRLTGRRKQKATCPQCGRRRCLVRYVDTHNDCRYLDDSCGRCDHEQSCGYHYRPAEFFRDHPWRAEACKPLASWKPLAPTCPQPQPQPRPLTPLAISLVDKFHSPQSIFWQWMSTDCASRIGLQAADIQRVYEAYHIGATSKAEVIFWQIDEQQRVRTGHLMRYAPDGHRQGRQNWMHNCLPQADVPSGFNLRQCFFGQHLLTERPEAHVCIVESEKTALIMAACHEDEIWLATCGSSGLNAEKLECLRNRRLTIFPDSGCYKKWLAIMQQTSGFQYNITDALEAYPPNTDIADLLLKDPD